MINQILTSESSKETNQLINDESNEDVPDIYSIRSVYSEITRVFHTESQENQNTESIETGCGLSHTMLDEDFDTIDEAVDWIVKNYSITDKDSNINLENLDSNRIYAKKLVADHSDKQNGGWFEPTKEELSLWKKGKFKLYEEEYFFTFKTY